MLVHVVSTVLSEIEMRSKPQLLSKATTHNEQPLYLLSEASRYLQLPSSTVRNWSLGFRSNERSKPPLIPIADSKRQLLSFSNLVELHILASLRRIHGVSHQKVKKSLDYLKRNWSVERPLLEHSMMTDGKSVFVEQLGSLVNISEHGQCHFREMLEAHLKRIEWNADGLIFKLYPFTRTNSVSGPMVISISPGIRSGVPCVNDRRIPTEIIAGRHRAGDSIQFLSEDYDCDVEEIEEAIRYESRTAA